MIDRTTYSHDGPVCPYCGHQHRNDDSQFYNENLSELECGSCGKVSLMRVCVSWSWVCEQFDDVADPTP